MSFLSKTFLIFDSMKRMNISQIYYLVISKFSTRLYVGYFVNNNHVYNYRLSALDIFRFNESDFYLKSYDVATFDGWNIPNNKHNQVPSELLNNHYRFHFYTEIFSSVGKLELLKQYILRWIDEHRKIRGEEWLGFNTALRVLNWLKFLVVIEEKNIKFSDDEYRNFISSILFQAEYTFKHLEYHIPGNHILYQLFVTWLTATVFPDWEKSQELAKDSKNKLFVEIDKQFQTSGLHFEKSYHYHVQCTLLIVVWFNLLQKESIDIPDYLRVRIKKSVEIAINMRLPDGSFPMIGDNCYTFLTPSLKSDLKFLEKLSEKLYGKIKFEEGLHKFNNEYILWRSSRDYVLLDVGNIGLKCNAGHGHSDISAIIYASHGTPIFVDPGTRNYSNSSEDCAVKTATSHNTLSIRGEDQAKLWGFFRWAYLPEDPKYSIEKTDTGYVFESEYAGFRHLGKYVHRRRVNIEPEKLNISDFVEGKNIEKVFCNFVLSPTLDVELKGSEVEISSEQQKWHFKVASNFLYNISIKESMVYPEYNRGIPTFKIVMEFNVDGSVFETNFIVEYDE